MGVSLKPSGFGQSTITGVPSVARTMSSYDTRHGADTSTSPSVFRVAVGAGKVTGLAPPPCWARA
ncbi:hypothetical protein EAO69_21885 [Streptomyces sp. me109]|nr:hypothetical protein EAO69_21885 [Streptomyces sp. me109]